MQILVIDGHPNAASLTTALLTSYAEGASKAGAEVHVLRLRDLDFDLVLRHGLYSDQPLEPDLQRARELLVASDHVVVATPVWWGSITPLLKGFFDRVLERGWAYRYRDNGLPEGLLAGRTSRVMITTDSPQWFLRGIMGDTTVRQIKRSTLAFCAMKPVSVSRFGPVHASTPEGRAEWIADAARLGERDAQRTPSATKVMPRLVVATD